MRREIKTHAVNGLNEVLRVAVLDEPGQGNACHRYQIEPIELDTMDVCSDPERGARLSRAVCRVTFQTGPIAEAGVNGISNDALLAIVRDRLEGFQSGPYACGSNADALLYVVAAMEALASRTAERVARGVEGTHTI